MEQLATSLTIIRHSLGVLIRHPRLLIFPVISMAGGVVVYIFFLAPMLFDTTMGGIWDRLSLPDERWDAIAPWRAGEATGTIWQQHFMAYVIFYLMAMFTSTFVNVALFSQIIEAINGGRVSVMRGLAVACSRLRAIVEWSIMAGVVGALVRMLQERLGFPGKWVAAFAGLSWSAASIFVIPVIIREPESRSPLHYVRTSTSLVKRVWGEGVAGITSLTLLLVLVVVIFTVAMTGVQSSSDYYDFQMVIVSTVAMSLIFSVLYLGWQIFQCGLYVYATEGVAPGAFDERMFDRIWTLKGDAGARERVDANGEPKAARRMVWSRLWKVIPLAFAGFAIWVHFYSPQFTRPLMRPETYVGWLTINMAELEYKLSIDDFRAAGLFVDEKDPATTLFSEGSGYEYFDGTIDAGMRATIGKNGKHLLVHFYSEERSAGQDQIRHAMHLLQSRFPGHEKAIVFEPYFLRRTIISWPAMTRATSYGLEIDVFGRCAPERWCTDVGGESEIVTGLRSTTYTYDSVVGPPMRVRVWGINASGRRGLKSPWATFNDK